MRRMVFVLIVVAIAAGVIAFTPALSVHADEEASPIYGVKIPAGYRDWKLIAADHLLVAGKADQLRAQLGNYPELGKNAARLIPNAKLIEYPDLGHAPQMQDPERFHRALLDNLAP